jgi:hypothetical protein
VRGLRAVGVTPHIAPNITTRRDSTLDWRTLRHLSGIAVNAPR